MKSPFTSLLLAGMTLAMPCFAAETRNASDTRTLAASAIAPWLQYTTYFLLGFEATNGIVPPNIGQRARVYQGDKVVLRLSDDSAAQAAAWINAGSTLQWAKNGVPIDGATNLSYTIALADSGAAGSYTLGGAPFPYATPALRLEVGSNANLDNFSSRFELVGFTPQITGFSIGGFGSKTYLIRAVGPSLRPYGITRPAAQPHLRLFDSTGKELIYVYPAVVIDWTPIFNSVGAFPLGGGEPEHIAFGSFSFAPGNYSAQVGDDAGQGGTVLLEFYELR